MLFTEGSLVWQVFYLNLSFNCQLKYSQEKLKIGLIYLLVDGIFCPFEKKYLLFCEYYTWAVCNFVRAPTFAVDRGQNS